MAWREVREHNETVTYINSSTNESVTVKYADWFALIDEDGEGYWWNASTEVSAWERPGWNTAVENGIRYFFNNITKEAALEKPASYPAERPLAEYEAARRARAASFTAKAEPVLTAQTSNLGVTLPTPARRSTSGSVDGPPDAPPAQVCFVHSFDMFALLFSASGHFF